MKKIIIPVVSAFLLMSVSGDALASGKPKLSFLEQIKAGKSLKASKAQTDSSEMKKIIYNPGPHASNVNSLQDTDEIDTLNADGKFNTASDHINALVKHLSNHATPTPAIRELIQVIFTGQFAQTTPTLRNHKTWGIKKATTIGDMETLRTMAKFLVKPEDYGIQKKDLINEIKPQITPLIEQQYYPKLHNEHRTHQAICFALIAMSSKDAQAEVMDMLGIIGKDDCTFEKEAGYKDFVHSNSRKIFIDKYLSNMENTYNIYLNLFKGTTEEQDAENYIKSLKTNTCKASSKSSTVVYNKHMVENNLLKAKNKTKRLILKEAQKTYQDITDQVIENYLLLKNNDPSIIISTSEKNAAEKEKSENANERRKNENAKISEHNQNIVKNKEEKRKAAMEAEKIINKYSIVKSGHPNIKSFITKISNSFDENSKKLFDEYARMLEKLFDKKNKDKKAVQLFKEKHGNGFQILIDGELVPFAYVLITSDEFKKSNFKFINNKFKALHASVKTYADQLK